MSRNKALETKARMSKERILVISIAAILVFAAASSNLQAQVVNSHSLEKLYSTCSTVQHVPIQIHGDAELQSAGFPGEGTSQHPYRIEGLNITTDLECIWIQDTSKFVTIDNCVFGSQNPRTGVGINCMNVTNLSVENCSISGKTEAILFFDSSDCLISDCRFKDVGTSQESLNCCNMTLASNTMDQDAGPITATEVTRSFFLNNTLIGDRCEFVVMYSNNTVIANNSIEYTGPNHPLDIKHSSSITILNNTLTGLSQYGLLVESTNHTRVGYNTIREVQVGLTLSNSYNLTLFHNDIADSGLGIQAIKSWTNLTLNQVHNASDYGIFCWHSPNSVVCMNEVTKSGNGGAIWIEQSDGTVVEQNNISGSLNDGMYIVSNSTVVRKNRVVDSGSNSIRVMYCNASIADNHLEGCTEWGTILTGCQSAQVLDNIHYGTGGITSQEGSVNSIIRNNTVIDSFRVGVTARNSQNCLIENNTIDDSIEPSIDIEYFSNSTIVRANYVKNSAGYGIQVLNSSDCIVESNLVEDSKNMGIHTIDAESTGIFNNTVLNCQTTGIYIKYSLDTTVSGNVVNGSVDKDVVAYHSSSCLVFLNSFESSLSVLGENDQSNLVQWDNGTYGNYWANYVGHDDNFDGIGDTPYYVNINEIDHYPLVDSSIVDVVRGLRQVPVIQIAVLHSPDEPTAGTPITFNITTTWIGWVSEVRLSYSVDGGTPISVTATRQGSVWMAEVPEQNGPCTIEYRVYVQDIRGNLISSDERVITIAGNGSTSNTIPGGSGILENPMFLMGVAGAFIIVIAVAFEAWRRSRTGGM